MKHRFAKAGLPAVLVFAMSVAATAHGQNLVADPSFESGALAPNWQTASQKNHGAWTVATGAPPATEGKRYAQADFDFLDGLVLYQDVTLPTAGDYVVQATVGCLLEGAKTPGDFCRFDVTGTEPETMAAPTPREDSLASTAGGVLKAMFAADGDRGTVAMGKAVEATFSATAGQTVRLRAMALASSRSITMQLDNVVVRRR